MRNGLELAVASAAMAVVAAGCAVSSVQAACPESSLRDTEVRAIAVAEFQQRGGIFREPYWDYRIRTEGCRIFFYASHKEAAPGLHFGVELDRNGKVVNYIPGA
jgi:hypothetical protein